MLCIMIWHLFIYIYIYFNLSFATYKINYMTRVLFILFFSLFFFYKPVSNTAIFLKIFFLICVIKCTVAINFVELFIS
ncbi:hypothetical protein C1645_325329 [Glomus cerebriforme]|uniref:Uncharacterized protein n=1 Tax=Glomus cerebriforme TaxID=658196 RepID=A0A397SKS9_9GLOM|nr:hypothetical protein C1645_325329 [Glomus cerebriforme]